MLRRRSIGLDGADAEYCDLSGRGLSSSQVERTLRVFDTAVAIDMSNNELEQIPTTIPKDLVALDVSFNMIVRLQGVEHLKCLQELNLSFNRIADVSILEFCPLLKRVNLSGNRLLNTKGLETLHHLENLDLSDNLIEFPEAVRALSLNQNLTHLALRGNPIIAKADYRVLVMDMIPSVLILDDKKIRASIKCKTSEACTTKTLSYSRIYDDKKQFVIRNPSRPTLATRPAPVLLGTSAPTSRFEGNTIFLQSPTSASRTHDSYFPTERIRPPHCADAASRVSPPPVPVSSTLRLTSPTAGAPYMSMYDRLAQANGIPMNKVPAEPPTVPGNTGPNGLAESSSRSGVRTRRESAGSAVAAQPQSVSQQRRSVDANTGKSSGRAAQSRAQTPAQPTTPPSARTASSYSPQVSASASTLRTTQATSPSPRQSTQFASPAHVSTSPPPSQHTNLPQPHIDPKQQNVLSVIQNLIHHKKQTLATLARQSSGTTGMISS